MERMVRAGLVALLLLAVPAAWALAYGEGPSDSGRWVYGRVTYGDGSKCGTCCDLSVETENGFSKSGCTDRDGNYKIYIASNYVRGVYFRGTQVWSGNRSAEGGYRVDIVAR